MPRLGEQIVANLRVPILSESDKSALIGCAEHLILGKHPSVLLDGRYPVLCRYYVRALLDSLEKEGLQSFVCPPRFYGQVQKFLSENLREVTLAEASGRSGGNARLLVFKRADRLGQDELVLLRELQTSFPGLAIACLFVGPIDLIPDDRTRKSVLSDSVLDERIGLLRKNRFFHTRKGVRIGRLLVAEARQAAGV